MSKKYLYKFLRKGLKSQHDGSAWKIGEWREVDPPEKACLGLNASEYVQDALNYVQGEILAKVECGGKIIKDDDKWTCEKMRIVSVADWTWRENVEMAVYAARLALSVWKKYESGDDRVEKAIEAAEAVLEKPCKKTRDAARAAWAAARAAWAASDAAWAAARAAWAASDAAWAASDAAWAASDAARAAWAAARAAWAASDAARKKIHLHALSLVIWRTK